MDQASGAPSSNAAPAISMSRVRMNMSSLPASLPSVAQFPQLQEHGPGVRRFGKVREALAQPGVDPRILQAEEGIDTLLLPQGRHRRRLRGRVLRRDQKLRRLL